MSHRLDRDSHCVLSAPMPSANSAPTLPSRSLAARAAALGLGLSVALVVAGCGGGGGSTAASPNPSPAPAPAPSASIDGGTMFPVGLAMTSPVSMTNEVLTLSKAEPLPRLRALAAALAAADFRTAGQIAFGLMPVSEAQAAVTRSPRYLKAANAINALLSGTVTPRAGTAFDAVAFLKTPVNAGCYGPTVKYEGHPDGSPSSGELPSGDVGLWTALDTSTGWACASAQLDARMDGVSGRVNTGLMTLASLINVASAAGKSKPAVGATLDLKADMNTAFSSLPAAPSFTTASVSQPTAGTFTYTVQFDFKDGSVTRKAEISLTHTPGASRSEYTGLLTYALARGSGDLQNCPGSSGGTVDVGTLKYTRTSTTAMTLVHREGNYCGAGTAAALATTYASFSADGQLDPAGKWTGTKGWANNFNRFGAVYDPTTMQGSYAYGWQAGHMDGNARVFNIGLNFNSSTSVRNGEAYFGYGSDISTSDGKIQGFICNWAGPGNSHALKDYFQRQHITFDDTAGKWLPTNNAAASSNITYAPTNSCASAGGSFYYDKAGDGLLTDDKAVSPNPAVTTDLADKVFGPTTYATVPLAIAGRGMTVPGF